MKNQKSIEKIMQQIQNAYDRSGFGFYIGDAMRHVELVNSSYTLCDLEDIEGEIKALIKSRPSTQYTKVEEVRERFQESIVDETKDFICYDRDLFLKKIKENK